MAQALGTLRATALPEDDPPLRAVGHLAPLDVIGDLPYEFYRLAPARVMLVSISMGLLEFSARDVERVFAPLDRLTAQLVERGVDIVVQGGVPSTSTVLCVIEAVKALGITRLAVANKWSEAMNRSLGEFFAEDGVRVVGASTRSMAPAEFLRLSSREGTDLAYALGRGALEACPDADGLYIGGGAWLSLPAALRLEQELGKPVVNNQSAMVWDVCRRLGCWQPRGDLTRLMAMP